MKNIKQTFLILTILGMMLAGCVSKPMTVTTPTVEPTIEASATLQPIQIIDGLDRTVTLEQPAQRIVSLAPSATEILFALGAGSQVVGRDSFSNYPEAVKEIQDVGGSMGSYSYEKITSLNPDLVVAAEINTSEQVKAIEDLGLTVYYIENPADLEGLYPILETVGILTGHTDEAAALVSSLKNRVETVVSTIAKSDSHPVVFYELDGSEPAKPWTPGPDTFLDQLIQMAGGVNLGSSLTSAWAQISVEEILVKDPDMILLGDSIYGMSPEIVAQRPGWESLRAIKQDQIFGFNDDLVSRPGPRLVDGLEELAKLIHPELFK